MVKGQTVSYAGANLRGGKMGIVACVRQGREALCPLPGPGGHINGKVPEKIVVAIPVGKILLFPSLPPHNLRNGIQNLIVAAATAGGTMGDLLDFPEGLLHILKFMALLQSLLHIKAADLLAIADHIIYHNVTS